ncbi:MAG: methyltransferase domain-containing protein [Candidatus Pacebacteria bacterium]|nr:methyltransferase domain-containing protein [Candidatus Paceibacterota bacterium]
MDRHREFWNREYQTSEHLALSSAPAEDLQKFVRFLERRTKHELLNPRTKVLDLGCGNGRNLIYLAESFGMRGTGYDISNVAIQEAERASKDLPIQYEVRSIVEPLPQPDESINIVLDMMTSHFLKKAEREKLREEIVRVLRTTGWFFFKSFLAEEDLNVKRLLREHPADEENSYIHPELGVYEHVWTEDEIHEFFGPYFDIHKVHKSHKHLKRGRAGKRRTISAYLQKL